MFGSGHHYVLPLFHEPVIDIKHNGRKDKDKQNAYRDDNGHVRVVLVVHFLGRVHVQRIGTASLVELDTGPRAVIDGKPISQVGRDVHPVEI